MSTIFSLIGSLLSIVFTFGVPIIIIVVVIRGQNRKHQEIMKELKKQNINTDPFAAPSHTANTTANSAPRPDPLAHISNLPPPKKRNPDAGLNAALYVGALLIVASAGALISANLPDAAKLLGLTFVVIAFYSIGFWLRNYKRFKIAGNAFVGTALALIPFLGLAFGYLTNIDNKIIWLLTSLIALAAYIFATIALKNKVISYFSMVVLISLVCSMSANFQLGLIYYFLFTMMISLAAALLQLFHPKLVPAIFREVIDVTAKCLTPLTLLASATVAYDTNSWFYVLLTGIAAAQYLVVWLRSRNFNNETIMRLTIHVFVLVSLYNIFNKDMLIFGVCFIMVALGHACLSLILSHYRASKGRAQTENVFQIIMLVFLFWSCVFFRDYRSQIIATAFAVSNLLICGLCIASVFLRKSIGFAYGAIVTSIIATIAFGTGVFSPEWPAEYYLGIFIPLMLASLAIAWILKPFNKTIRRVPLVALILYGIVSFFVSLNTDGYWQVAVWATFAASLILYGYLLKNKILAEVGIYVGALSMVRLTALCFEPFYNTGDIEAVLRAYIIGTGFVTVSLWREKKNPVRPRLILAAACITLVTGVTALSSGQGWDLFFLVEMVVLLGIGLALKLKWMWIWGIVGIVLSVLWFTQGITWLWLFLLGVGIIGGVVFALARKKPEA